MATHEKSTGARTELTTEELEQAFLTALEKKPEVVAKGLREMTFILTPWLANWPQGGRY